MSPFEFTNKTIVQMCLGEGKGGWDKSQIVVASPK